MDVLDLLRKPSCEFDITILLKNKSLDPVWIIFSNDMLGIDRIEIGRWMDALTESSDLRRGITRARLKALG